MTMTKAIEKWLLNFGLDPHEAFREAAGLVEHLTQVVAEDTALTFYSVIKTRTRLALIEANRAADAQRKRDERAAAKH